MEFFSSSDFVSCCVSRARDYVCLEQGALAQFGSLIAYTAFNFVFVCGSSFLLPFEIVFYVFTLRAFHRCLIYYAFLCFHVRLSRTLPARPRPAPHTHTGVSRRAGRTRGHHRHHRRTPLCAADSECVSLCAGATEVCKIYVFRLNGIYGNQRDFTICMEFFLLRETTDLDISRQNKKSANFSILFWKQFFLNCRLKMSATIRTCALIIAVRAATGYNLPPIPSRPVKCFCYSALKTLMYSNVGLEI